MPSNAITRHLVLPLSLALSLFGLQLLVGPAPAGADPGGTALVISEAYVNGGSSGATYTSKFVELYNPTGAAITLGGDSIQYRPATSSGNATNFASLSGSVASHGYFLIQGGSNGANGGALPTPDQVATTINAAAGGGTVFIASTTTAVDPSSSAAVIDKLSYGTGNTPEGDASGAGPTGNSVTKSLSRNATNVDTDDNHTDFTAQTPTPTNSGGAGGGGGGGGGANCPAAPQTIAQIQGDTDTSPCAGSPVTTTGVVTASYPTGGFNGFYLQTGGTPATPGESDAIFVYGGPSGFTTYPTLGSTVDVAGTVSEFQGQTEIDNATVTPDATAQPAVVPQTVVPDSDCTTTCPGAATVAADREAHESELYLPSGAYTVTDPYDGSPAPSTSSSNFGEIGLAAERQHPLQAPTELFDTQTQAAQIAAQTVYNTDHLVILDDGSSANLSSNTATPFPWLTLTHTVRDGAAVSFVQPMVLSYRNSEWTFEPQSQVTDDGSDKVTIAQDRPAAPTNVGGNLRLATFNVLNYFPTTGQDYVNAGLGSCTYYDDRAGNHITTKECDPTGPRGAADAANLQRQQDKIVHAINRLGADIVSLEEIENSIWFNKPRDYGVSTLVNALNADEGAGTWAFAPSPDAADLPPQADQDVIRTAFIYKPASVSLVGGSTVLTGSSAFSNAREPLAQAFKPKGDPDSSAFAVVVNHFKSKGDDGASPATGDNVDTGQGYYNGDRVRQADAMTAFVNQFKAARGVSAVFLTGDYNAYSQEDPVQEVESAGYTDLGGQFDATDKSYSFGGLDGSLDHVFANPAALAMVTGADIWQINANESVYYEYSRYNYNATNLYDSSPYRASDHNPEVVGINLPAPAARDVQISASFGPAKVIAKKTQVTVSVHLSATGVTPTGQVTVTGAGVHPITVYVTDSGSATLTVGRFTKPGTYPLQVAYSGDELVKAGTATVTVTVKKAKKKHRHHHHHHGH